MIPPQIQYDKSAALFSPDGRLVQVEYARESVKRGSISLGIVYDKGIVLISHKQILSPLIKSESIEKIFQIDDHIGIAISGMTADAKFLVDKARLESQINVSTYDEPIGVEYLTKRICDITYLYTQSSSVRPLGTSLLVAGKENEIPRLFETDPSGTFFEYNATAIGNRREQIMKYLEDKYSIDLSLKQAILLGADALLEAGFNINIENIEIVSIENCYFKFSENGIKKFLDKSD